MKEFYYTIKWRNFEPITKGKDDVDWGWDGPITGEADPNYVYRYPPRFPTH